MDFVIHIVIKECHTGCLGKNFVMRLTSTGPKTHDVCICQRILLYIVPSLTFKMGQDGLHDGLVRVARFAVGEDGGDPRVRHQVSALLLEHAHHTLHGGSGVGDHLVTGQVGHRQLHRVLADRLGQIEGEVAVAIANEDDTDPGQVKTYVEPSKYNHDI